MNQVIYITPDGNIWIDHRIGFDLDCGEIHRALMDGKNVRLRVFTSAADSRAAAIKS